jgi:hypothetical protein
MNKKIIAIVSLISIVTIAVAYAIMNWLASPVLYVDPKTVNGTVGQDFTINISTSNVADLYGWELKLKWNTTILEAVNVTEGPFLKAGGETFFYPKINNTLGYIAMDCALLGNITGVSGKGPLVAIGFHVKENGNCELNLYDTILLNSSEEPITHTVNDGYFST